MSHEIKPIALYLPQFHPIPENDEWWGKGFTEWTNVTKAKPLFKEHWQPRLPADLGFYDLRIPEVREAQAKLAKEHGIYGFCYWHYWFAGKRILERPFEEVVQNGKPDFPFCLAWANQSWKGTWHGLSNEKILIEQTYPGEKDYEEHFYSLLEAFRDPRYIEIEGKKLFFIFQPFDIPKSTAFIDLWQQLACKEGFNGFHFVGMNMTPEWRPKKIGYDAAVQYWSQRNEYKYRNLTSLDKFRLRFRGPDNFEKRRLNKSLLLKLSYKKLVESFPFTALREDEYPSVFCNWDNTPRCGKEGWLFEDCTPELFGKLCQKAFNETTNKPNREKIVIIKSWNEWAEGNYLEPDQKFGKAYLEQFKNALTEYNNKNLITRSVNAEPSFR